MDEAADKQRLRAAARKIRAEAQAADRDNLSADRLASQFMAAFSRDLQLGPVSENGGPHPETIVAGYWPLGSEMNVRPLMIRLAAAGAQLVLPEVRDSGLPLAFRRWQPGDPLRTGQYGVMQPVPPAPLAIPAVLLVPLLAFDKDGWRLGYGAGYYDRTLAELRARPGAKPPLAIGIAYAAQEMQALPHHGGDHKLDGVVTELSARRFV